MTIRTTFFACVVLALSMAYLPELARAQYTWTQPISNTKWTLLAIDFSTDVIGYAAGHQGEILKTTDAGQTWQQLNSPTFGHLLDIEAVGRDTVIAIGNNGEIHVSTDAGSTWGWGANPMTQDDKLTGLQVLNNSVV